MALTTWQRWSICALTFNMASVFAAPPPVRQPAPDAIVLTLPAQLPAEPQHALAQALRSGDQRALGQIEARLSGNQSLEALLVRAYIAQHQHEFGRARVLLDQLIARAPRDVEARHVRADVLLAQGELRLAERDCAALVVGLDLARGALCTAALASRRGQLDAAQGVLLPLLQNEDLAQPLRHYAWRLAGDIALQRGDLAAVETAWLAALALDPADQSARLRLARLLREQGKSDEARDLLSGLPEQDAVLMELAWLARADGDETRARLFAEQVDRRLREGEQLGAGLELADQARWRAEWHRDWGGALALAELNFEIQRGESDETLLRTLAEAVDDRAALMAIQQWRQSQGLPEQPR